MSDRTNSPPPSRSVDALPETTSESEEVVTPSQDIEILDDEWNYYAFGHVDQAAFLDACERYEIECEVYGPEEAVTESVKAHYAPDDVRHVWYVDAEDPQNDELMRLCDPDTPGAEPFTLVPTP